MKKMLVFVFIMAIGVATLLAPVNAQEASGQQPLKFPVAVLDQPQATILRWEVK